MAGSLGTQRRGQADDRRERAVAMEIVDVWIQHPTLRLANHDMFESLRRWTGMSGQLEQPLPVEMTIAAMDDAGSPSRWHPPGKARRGR
jgi:hypothetical protein